MIGQQWNSIGNVILTKFDRNIESHLHSGLCCIPHTYISTSFINSRCIQIVAQLYFYTLPITPLQYIALWPSQYISRIVGTMRIHSHHKWSNLSPSPAQHLSKIAFQSLFIFCQIHCLNGDNQTICEDPHFFGWNGDKIPNLSELWKNSCSKVN